MAAPDNPFPLQLGTITFGEDVFYRILDDLFNEGIVGASDLSVQQFSGGARMSVQVNIGEAYVTVDSPSYGGLRRIRQSTLTDSGLPGSPNAAENWSSTFQAADPTNPRIDRVVARVRDNLIDSSGLYKMEFVVIAGTPTSGATLGNLNGAAAVPSNSILLANVKVNAGASTIVTADIDTTVRPTSRIADGRVKVDYAGIVNVPVAVGYGTSLPGSPTDGQEYVLVDSITLPTYQWRFRYNNGSSNTDKWEFIGGAPAFSQVATAETTASTTYAALATAGPSIVLPRAGVYTIAIGFRSDTSATTAAVDFMSYDIGGTGAVDADSARSKSNDGAVVIIPESVSREVLKTGLTAVTLTAKYRVSAGTQGFADRWMRVVPVRVS